MKTGGCQCGQVRFEFSGEPINEVFCYCTDCQIRTGGDKWFGIWIPRENFKFTGKTKPATYTQQSGTGHDVHHYYCPNCGVDICADITVAEFFTVAAPCIDDSEKFKAKIAIFAASAPQWAILPTDIPVFDTVPPEMGG